MAFSDNKLFWTTFIELYKSLPCLWKIKDKKLYLNKDLKQQAYDKLVEKCKEINPEADVKYVKTKIESLKNGFRRELRLVRKSKRTGSSAENVYEPTLWYYDLMLFSLDQEEIRSGISSIGQGQDEEDTEDLDSPPHTPQTPESIPSSASSDANKTTNKKSLSFNAKKAKFLDVATAALTTGSKKEVRTGFEGFGETVAKDLNSMTNMQSIIAQKLISDILYYGKLGKLNENCSFSLPTNTILQQEILAQSLYPASSIQSPSQTRIVQSTPASQSLFQHSGNFTPSQIIHPTASQVILRPRNVDQNFVTDPELDNETILTYNNY